MRNKIKIFTDVQADLDDKFIKENNIGIFPIYYHFSDEKLYGKDLLMPKEEFYEKMEFEKPSTIGCNPDDIIELIKPYIINGYEILCIMFSAALSVGYNSSLIARDIILEEFPNSIINIIDSKKGSLSQGYMVHEAVRLYKENKDSYEIKEYLLSNINNFKCLFSVENLDYLIKSGRISHLKGNMANLLNLKPIFTFDNEGKLDVITKKRGLNKVLTYICEDIEKFGTKRIGIAHANNIELANKFKEIILKKLDNVIVDIVDLSYTVASNTGKGSFGISYYK